MDIAEIGFKADTSNLDKATASLTKLQAAASGTSASTGKVAQAVGRASVQVAAAKTAEARATLKAVQATQNASKADIEAARQAWRVAQAEEVKARALVKSAAAARSTATAQNILNRANAAGIGGFGGAGGRRGGGGGPRQTGLSATGVGRDQMPNRFNTANIAAQFQDIGVTAAMGMNPMLIAMQQGTQLSAIMTSMENPLKGLAVAFKQVFGSTAILTIGIVALVAAGLQMVNWIKVAQGLLNGLASTLEFIEPAILPIGAAMLVVFGPAMVASIASATVAVVKFGAAALATGAKIAAAWVMANPVTALAAVVAAIGIFAVTAIEPIRNFVNGVIGYFVGMFNGVKRIWDNIGQIIKGGRGAFAEARAIISEELAKTVGVDYVGVIGDGIAAGVDAAASKLRSLSAGLGAEDGKKSRGKSEAERYADIINGAQRTIATLEAERAAIGKTAYETDLLKRQTDLLNQAKQKNINLTPQMTAELMKYAEEQAKLAEGTRLLQNELQFTKGVMRDFIGGMKSDLANGVSAWEAFGNQITRIMDKIFDKFAEVFLIDPLFDMFKGTGSGGSLLSDMASWLFSAKGNAFSQSGVQAFAKGGAFTNSVVSRPTAFTFANGGSFGVMGEAGPEAVMPLHRGSDGSLGVKVTNDSSNGGERPVVINIVNNNGSSVRTRSGTNGADIDVLIDEAVARKMSQSGSQINQAMGAYNSRGLVKR